MLNTSQIPPNSPLLQYYQTEDTEKYKWPTDDSNIKIPATPDSVKSFLKDAGLDFSKYDKYQCKKQGESKKPLPDSTHPSIKAKILMKMHIKHGLDGSNNSPGM